MSRHVTFTSRSEHSGRSQDRARRMAFSLALGMVVSNLSPLVTSEARADATWTGGTSQDWNNVANWSTNPTNPSGNFFINTATGNYPVLNADSAFTPVDLVLGDGAGQSGQLDQVAGTLLLANTSTNGNWMFVGRGNGTGTYNLTGSGSLATGKLWVGGVWNAEGGTGTVNVNTTGSITANSTDADGGFSGQIAGSVIVGWATFPSGSSNATLNLQSGTINANGGGLWVGAWGSTSTFNMTGGTVNAASLSLGRWFSASSTMNVTNGTVNVSGITRLAHSGAANDSNHAQLNVNGGGTLNSEGDFVAAFAGDGVTALSAGELNIAAGGTVNVATTTERWFIVNQNDTVQGRVNVNGGTLNLSANADLRFSTGNGTGTSVVNLNSGAITAYSGNKTGAATSSVVDLNRNGADGANNTFNLNGGVLTITQVITTVNTGTAAFNFNGGTLKATASNTNFVDLGGANQVANVRNGGAVIDTNGNNVAIVQPLVHSTIDGDNATDGGLTKNGAGVLTLSGTNSYNGPTTINAGGLALANGSLTGGVAIPGGGSFGASGASSVAGLSFSGAGTFTIDLGTALANNPAILSVTGALNVDGSPVMLNVNHTGPLTSGIYSLASLGSFTGTTSNLVLGTVQGLNAGRQTAQLNASNSALSLTITGAAPVWHGQSSTNWSTNTSDTAWNVNGNDTFFLDNDVVLFDDTGVGTAVNVVGTVLPSSMTFTNNSKNYTITGSGKIGGFGSLTKQGTGTLTIATANTYGGGTTVTAGQLNINNASALGTGPLVLGAAENVLDNTSGSPVTMAGNNVQIWNGNVMFGGTNALNLGTGAVTLNVNPAMVVTVNGATGLTVGGAIGNGAGNSLTKAGTGTLVLAGANSYTGTTIINAGAVQVTGGTMGATGADIQIAPNTADVGTLTVNGGTVNANRVIIAGTSGNDTSPGTGVINQSGGTINSQQWFTVGSGGNGTGLAGGAGTYNLTGGTLNVMTQQMEVGNFAGTTGTVNMSGSSAINIYNSNFISMGANPNAVAGTFNQNGGAVTFYSDAGTTVGGNGILYLGRSATSNGTFTYNLNGGSLTVPQVSHGGGTGVFNFNGGTLRAARANATFMSGLTSANVQAGGAIINSNGFDVTVGQPLVHDTAGPAIDGGLTKAGAGALTLGAANTYTGPTTISGGTIRLPAGSTPTAVGVYTFDDVMAGGNPVTSGSLDQGYVVPNTGSGGATMNGTVNNANNILESSGGSIVDGVFGGKALELDGLGSTVDVANRIVDQGGASTWTMSLWLKTGTPGSAFVSKNTGPVPPATTEWATGYSTFYLASNPPSASTGAYPTAVRNGGGFLQGNVEVADGNWHMVTFVGNAGARSVYVDGVAVALSQGDFNNADVSTFVRLGYNTDTLANLDGNVQYAGDIDEVKFYTAALSPSQIASLYASNSIGADATQYLPATTAVNITASGAGLDLNGTNQTIGSLAGVGGSSVTLGTATLTVGGNNTATSFAGGITGSGGVTKTGSGVWTVSGTNNYGGATTVSAGVMKVTGITKTASVGVSGGAALDLGGKLILDYAGGSSPLASILPQLQASRGAGTWAGTAGIISTGARNDANKLTTIGYAETANLLGASGGTWNGLVLNGTSLVLMYTYYGDLNLDGKVNADDYVRLDRGAAKHLTGWINGDVNYDGTINSGDYQLTDRAFALQSGGLSADFLAMREAQFGSDYVASLVAAVPEPGTIGLAGLAAAGLLGRRRRTHG